MLTRTDIILRALARLQPATRAQIAEHVSIDSELVGHALQGLRRAKKAKHGEPTHQTLSTGQEVEVVTWIALVDPPEEPRTEDGICGPIVAQALARRCELHRALWGQA